MKTMVKLTVLIATLLLLTGGAFAGTNPPCNCYILSWNALDNYGPMYGPVLLCSGPNNQGRYGGFCFQTGGLSWFFDQDPVQALGYNPLSESPEEGYLKFHDSRLTVFNGIWNCDGNRYNVWGRITNLSNCLPYSCIDGTKNGNETDVDCGGGTCQPCFPGKHCSSDNDCLYYYPGACSGNICQPD
jgi:hypothetical protein